LIALFHGQQFRDLLVTASACVPACHLSHRLPEHCLLVSPLAAVAEEVLPRLGHCPFSPPALVILSVAEQFEKDSSGRMLGV